MHFKGLICFYFLVYFSVTTGTGSTLFVDPHGNVIDEQITEDFQNLMTKLDEEDSTNSSCSSYGEFRQQRWVCLLIVIFHYLTSV